MAAVKSKKDTKAPVKKTPVKKTAAKKAATPKKDAEAGSKRKRVTFEDNKTAAVAESDEEEDIISTEVTKEEEEEDLTEEQEEALRKEILGDIASSSEGEDSSDEEADGIDANENVVALDAEKLKESMTETKQIFDKKASKAKKVYTELCSQILEFEIHFC